MAKPDSLQESLDLLVLKILSRRPHLHGYAIMSAIKQSSGDVLARTVWSPNVPGDWTLSPDGAEVAIPNHDPHNAMIRLVPLTRHTAGMGKTITLNGLTNLNGVTWTADGRGWYACARTGSGGLLVYADRQGRTSELLESSGWPYVVPSPDGRHVAFPLQTGSSNAWLVRGF